MMRFVLQYPLNVLNLVGMQPDVRALEDGPPSIRLPSNVSSVSPLAQISVLEVEDVIELVVSSSSSSLPSPLFWSP
jgi:hypothetical protein